MTTTAKTFSWSDESAGNDRQFLFRVQEYIFQKDSVLVTRDQDVTQTLETCLALFLPMFVKRAQRIYFGRCSQQS